jgi:hypothetical protein
VFYCWARKEALVGLILVGLTSYVIFSFNSYMHRSGNIVPRILGTRSSSVGNIRNEYTHVPKWFRKMVFHVPRSRSSFLMFREHGF